MRASFGHPVRIDDGGLTFSSVVVVPVPCFGVDGLADTTEYSQRGQVVVLDVLFTHSAQKSDGGRSSVELGGLPLVDKVPVTRRGRIDRSRLEDGGGHTDTERTVDDVGVASDPANIGHAGVSVGLRVDVKNVFHGEEGRKKVATGGVDDTFGFASGARGLI